MANWSDPQSVSYGARQGAAYDAGLRTYMLSVYNYMASAVLLTALIAMAIAKTSLIDLFVQQTVHLNGAETVELTGLGIVAAFAPLAFGLPLAWSRGGMKIGTLQTLFWCYAVAIGVSFSTLFVAYTDTSIAQAFFASAAAFAGLSLFGYTTKRDLSAIGAFLIMGVVGILIALVINMFLQSAMFDLVISIAGVLIFAGLTAFRTQEIKLTYDHVAGTEMEHKVAVLGAFRLYVSFINMFLFLLRLMGSSRN